MRSLTSSVDTCEAARVIRCPIADLHSLPHTFSFIIPHRKGFGINMLTGVDRPTSGRVIFGNEELGGRSENALARWRGQHVGVIFQFFQLVPTLTAVENVLLALELGKGGGLPKRDWRKRAQECLETVGLSAFARRC